MGIKLLKLLLIIFALITSVFMFFLGSLILSEGRHPIDPYIDTCFAPDFSPKKFKNIKIGMTINEVESIIGKPLHVGHGYSNNSRVICYVYTGDGKILKKKKEKEKRNYYDCAWCYSSVTFDTKNIVIEINKKWIYD